MRLGGPVFEKYSEPHEWVAAVKKLGNRAAYCPVGEKADDAQVRAFADAARAADLVIAEVGAWSNTIATDDVKRRAAVALNQQRLALADRVGARCCVNTAGSRNPTAWAGPHPDNFAPATFDLIVETVRGIIDAVKPTRTFYALECMQWIPPMTADQYLDLIKAIDRKSFAVHFDPVNMMWSPERYYRTGEIIRDFAAKLGPHIRSCHAKDIILGEKNTVHLDEIRPGLGNLDYKTYLLELAKLDPDLPLMLEHLKGAAEYVQAATHVRTVAKEAAVGL